jgi:hypothetical protein
VPPRVLDIYPALANCECTHSAAAPLCVMAFHQPATVAHPTPKCHHESGSLASLALVIIIVANATARVESVFHSSNFQFALELTECTPDVWTCAHSRTWTSFAFCYKKDIDALCMYICVCVFALRDGFRTNQHLIELFGPPASSESQSNKNYRPLANQFKMQSPARDK